MDAKALRAEERARQRLERSPTPAEAPPIVVSGAHAETVRAGLRVLYADRERYDPRDRK